VTNLAVQSVTDVSVVLSFTEVDDGTGKPASYDIRYAIAPISWGTAAHVTLGTCAVPVAGTSIGAARTCTVLGLNSGTNYQFQLVAFRGTMNVNAVYGPLSNIASGTTTGAPPPPPPPGTYPNQPAGFVPITEHRFSCRPGEVQCQPLGVWTYEPGGLGNFSTQHDASAPQSPDSVGQTLFPNGQPSGSAPVWFDGWGVGGYASAFYSKLYVSLWVRIGGTDYENQAVGTKMGFIGYGQDPSGAANQGFAMLIGNGSQSIGSAFNLGFWQQNNVSRDMNQNVNTSKVMTVGPWHHWEWEMELNTLGSSNGVFKWWVDGTLITSYSDVVYITSGNTFGFYNYRWNPTWGGQGGTKTRNDYMYMDHIYISGVP
jgi:hypothetical protein